MTALKYGWMRQYLNSLQTMSTFAAYAQEIGCTQGEGAMYDCIEVHTEEQAALLNAKWRELTEKNHVA